MATSGFTPSVRSGGRTRCCLGSMLRRWRMLEKRRRRIEGGLKMTPDDSKPAIPTTTPTDGTKTRKIVANMLAVVCVVMFLLGLVHFAGLPLILEADRSGAINLPSIEEKGMGFHLVREQIANGLLMVGVDRCVFGAILLLCVPALGKGSRLAWRICMVIGSFTFVGYTALVLLIFDSFHLVPYLMPAMGLLILVPILVARHSFTVE